MNDEPLREPVNARGHRVVAHLSADFQSYLLFVGCPEHVARDLINGMLRRAHAAAARDAEDEAAAAHDTAALLERVLAR